MKSNDKKNPPVVNTKYYSEDPSSIRILIGFIIASFFSLVYFLAPIYVCTCIYYMVTSPSDVSTWKFASVMIISIIIPPMNSPVLCSKLTPMLDFFEYEEIRETSFEEFDRLVNEEGKTFILVCQPHGVISFTGFCVKIAGHKRVGYLPTAVAAALLKFPILKHVIGMYGLVDASSKNMAKVFRLNGVRGCIYLYVGGIAELFRCSQTEERLYLSKRKGFVKLALREGVDIVPFYFFGNTSILSVLSTGPLAVLSRKLGASVTYFWGFCGLPLPRFGQKCISVMGRPLGVPHIENPTQEDIDTWHAKYCSEVRRLYEQYQDKCPHYKNKPLFID